MYVDTWQKLYQEIIYAKFVIFENLTILCFLSVRGAKNEREQ